MIEDALESTDIRKITVILLKIGASFSMIGSSLILRDVWHRFREKKDIPLTAYLVSQLSLCDFFSSFFGPFLGTWMVPKETGAYLAAGTTASCTAQGFLNVTFYSASVLCNTSLAIAYCLIVKKGWKDSHTDSLGYWLLRGLPIISLFFTVGEFFDKAYNFGGVAICSMESYPLGCDSEGSEVECTRGRNAVYFKLLIISSLMVLNLIIIASILLLIHSVWSIEKKMDRYHGDGRISRVATLKTTRQGIWYIAAFGLAWWPFAIFYSIRSTDINPPAFLEGLFAVTWPLQGAYNAFVYFRPKYKSDRETHGNDARFTSVCRTLRVSELSSFLVNGNKRQSINVCPHDILGGGLDKGEGNNFALNQGMAHRLENAVLVPI